MTGKHKVWIKNMNLVPCWNGNRATECTYQTIERSIEQIRLSRELLRNDAPQIIPSEAANQKDGEVRGSLR